MADILIDLGEQWGHVLPLSTLENIMHIEVLSDQRMSVLCEVVDDLMPDKIRQYKIVSSKSFTLEEIEGQKKRLIGLTTGLISKEDVEAIMKTMEAQTGVTYNEVLKNPIYDLNFVRAIWASHMDQPYFRFILNFDPETQTVQVEDYHNEEFQTILTEWLGSDINTTTQPQDRIMLFAYDAIYRLAEPILPESETGGIEDPMADIPVMAVGGLGEQKVDISKMTSDQVIVGS